MTVISAKPLSSDHHRFTNIGIVRDPSPHMCKPLENHCCLDF